MSLLGIVLTPVTIAPRGLLWVFEKVQEEADRELNDPVRLRGELMTLQRRAASGELTDAQYEEQEELILARLDNIERRHDADPAASAEPTGPARRHSARSVRRRRIRARRGRPS
ncbi:MAG: gas vesicle protein GvpG [Actinomycetia bacterium]|nr:gas vesicle protein GvpG [Actinomycetes bacterium]